MNEMIMASDIGSKRDEDHDIRKIMSFGKRQQMYKFHRRGKEKGGKGKGKQSKKAKEGKKGKKSKAKSESKGGKGNGSIKVTSVDGDKVNDSQPKGNGGTSVEIKSDTHDTDLPETNIIKSPNNENNTPIPMIPSDDGFTGKPNKVTGTASTAAKGKIGGTNGAGRDGHVGNTIGTDVGTPPSISPNLNTHGSGMPTIGDSDGSNSGFVVGLASGIGVFAITAFFVGSMYVKRRRLAQGHKPNKLQEGMPRFSKTPFNQLEYFKSKENTNGSPLPFPDDSIMWGRFSDYPVNQQQSPLNCLAPVIIEPQTYFSQRTCASVNSSIFVFGSTPMSSLPGRKTEKRKLESESYDEYSDRIDIPNRTQVENGPVDANEGHGRPVSALSWDPIEDYSNEDDNPAVDNNLKEKKVTWKPPSSWE